MQLYFNWANDQSVRENAISKDPIPMDVHKIWFEKKLKNTDSFLYIFEWNNNPFGQVRFDMDEHIASIDYSVDKEYRGKGLGKKIMEMAIKQYLKDSMEKNPKQMQGIVKATNLASMSVFKNLGFILEKHRKIQGVEYVVFSMAIQPAR